MADRPGRLPARRGAWLSFAGWMLLADTVLASLFSLGYLRAADLPAGWFAHLFTPLMFIGQLATLVFLVFIPVFIVASLWPRRWLMHGLVLVLGSALLAGLGLDVMVYQQYRFHIDASILHLVFGGAAGQIFVFSGEVYLQGLLALAAIVLTQWLVMRGVEWLLGMERQPVPGWVIGLFVFGIVLAENGIYAWADAAGYTPVIRQADLMPAYYPLRDRGFFARFGVESEHVPGGALARGSFHYPQAPVQCTQPARPMNILFLLIDSWRFDALTRQATPNIWAFTRDNIHFTQHFSGGSATRTGIFAMMYGIPATYWQAALDSQTPPVLTRKLVKYGYRMGIFGSAPLTSPEFNRTVFADVPDLRLHSKATRPVDRDREIASDFLRFLDQGRPDQPFFGWLFFDSPHAYDVPDKGPLPFQPSWKTVNYLALGPDFDPEPFRNRYLNSVHFVDGLVGRVLDRLREKGLLDSTIVLISGDHGQEFNDTGRNFWGHNSAFDRFQTQVPLVVHWPGRGAGAVTYRTSHFDLPPTLLRDALGCSTDPSAYSVGHDLFRPGGRDFLLMANYTDYAIKTPERTLVVHPYQAVDVVGPDGHAVHGARPDPDLISRALQLRSRFLRTDSGR
ncbi:MAG: sulfatase-like hydrolase/transferase [Gammaproteobacteria bacterium]|jgi:hypothetical protein